MDSSQLTYIIFMLGFLTLFILTFVGLGFTTQFMFDKKLSTDNDKHKINIARLSIIIIWLGIATNLFETLKNYFY